MPMGSAHGAGRSRAPVIGHLALLAVQVCFGLFPIFAKLAMQHFESRAVAVWRFGFGSAALLALALARHGRGALPRRADLPRLAACALLGVAVNMVAFLEGLERSTAVNAAFLMPVIPVYTLAIAVLARQERFDPRRGAGIALALVGTLLLLFQRGHELEGGHFEGNLLLVLNTLCYASYLVLAKPLLARYPPLVLIAWVFTLSLWTIPFVHRGAPLVPQDADAASWIALAYILVFATLIAYLLNAFALSVVSASTTATYILLQPLITALAGVLVLHERVPPGTWLAAAAILGGVWLVVRVPALARTLAAPESP
jgi:drug/metabolite transporter (DMT)-like permease